MRAKQTRIREHKQLYEKEMEVEAGSDKIVANNDGAAMKQQIDKLEKRRDSFIMNEEERNEKFRRDKECDDTMLSTLSTQLAQMKSFHSKMKAKQARIQQQKRLSEE